MKKIFLMILLLTTFIFSGCNTQAASNGDKDLKIHMLNIGHGDAILIQTKKQTILVDTADNKRHEELVSELKKFSVTKIDKLILSHGHADHIGGAKMLIDPSDKELAEFPYLEKISVAAVYDNGMIHSSANYRNYMKAVATKKIPIKGLKAGDVLDFGGGVKFNVLFPTAEFAEMINSGQFDKEDKVNNVNNRSVVGKLTYGNFSMMFTGDCEWGSEGRVVDNNKAEDLKCDVLKAGHHGISNASTKKFLKVVRPSHVVISAGPAERTSTEHKTPYLRPLENYLAQGIEKGNIFCTAWDGTITISSDGKSFSVQSEHKEDWIDSWIARKKANQEY